MELSGLQKHLVHIPIVASGVPMIDLPGPGSMAYYGHAFIEYEGEGILVLEDHTELNCELVA